jgi:lipopolysaccharide export system permease protein
MNVEGHQRLAEPLHALGFTCIGLAFLLTGSFSRRGQTARIVGAIVTVVLTQAGALGAANLAGKDGTFIPLMYVVALLPIAAGMYIIMQPGWGASDRRPIPLDAKTA